MADLNLFHHTFATVVKRYPQRPAVVQADQTVTYAELDRQSTKLAVVLRAQGVAAGDVVALKLPRSVDLIVSILAILKSGAAYLPLDEANPEARLRQCLDIAKVSVIVSDDRLSQLLTEGRRVVRSDAAAQLAVDDFEPDPALADDAPAYVMFTSGATGAPKGVVVPYRAIVRLVIDSNYIQIGADDAILQFSPVSFDASTFEIWGALLNGAKLVLYSGEVLDPRILKSDIQDHNVSIAWLTAALFHMIANNYMDALRTLSVLLAGGDVLHAATICKVLDAIPGITIINGYGPTENTTFTCCHRMTQDNPPSRVVPIGRSISGTEVLILDDSRQAVQRGEVGELYATGLGVALGYLESGNDDDAFFRDERLSDGLIYRTGDLVRENSSGELEFCGRCDNQIKLRGFRVSLEDICLNLVDLDEIQDAVVFIDKAISGDQLLIAFLQLADGKEVDGESIRRRLAALVPGYMIPDKIVLDADLPVTQNGKLDRKQIMASYKRSNGRSQYG